MKTIKETDQNKQAYKSKSIVSEYAREDQLFPHEQAVLNLLKESLPEMRMLDIGVGGGRTTLHFARRVKAYIGIDYSREMIEACQDRFTDYPDHVSFLVGDMRSMDALSDNTFNFVLCSFNSMDYISHHDRLRALSEINRVGRSGGWFFLSTHNLKNHFPMFDLRKQIIFRRPRTTLKNLLRWARASFLYNNHHTIRSLKTVPYAIINDGVYDWALQTYYVKLDEQLRQLEPYFDEIRVFSDNGSEIEYPWSADNDYGNFLHYLCRIR